MLQHFERIAVLVLVAALGGCTWPEPLTYSGAAAQGGLSGQAMIENPLFVPVADPEFAWNQIVDEIDDYFKIQREERVRQEGHVMIEGRIDTFPTVGSTYLEPWRRDSTGGFEKLHSTLQSVRRRAQVRVVPSTGGYLLDVAVFKELEDLERPKRSSIGFSGMRHDNSLDADFDDVPQDPDTLGWIPQGRDLALEQRILSNLRGRLTDSGAVQSAALPRANVEVFPQPQ